MDALGPLRLTAGALRSPHRQGPEEWAFYIQVGQAWGH